MHNIRKTKLNSLENNKLPNITHLNSTPTLSRYKDLKLIGEGGLARVYKAFDTKLNRTVAIKILRKGITVSDKIKQRFMQEIRVQANINIEGCVKIFDYGQENGYTFCAMEYISGKSLKEFNLTKTISINEKISILKNIISIILKLHKAGFEHRDIKPENFIIDSNNKIHLLDFGLAKAMDNKTNIYTTTYGDFFGTPAYMSPESVDTSNLKTRRSDSDIYSFGVMSYEFLTGKLPYEIDHLSIDEVKYVIENEKPESINKYLPTLDNRIANIIDRTLTKNPILRPKAEEILKVLESYKTNSKSSFPANNNSNTYKYSISNKQNRTNYHRHLYVISGCTVAALIIVFGLFYIKPNFENFKNNNLSQKKLFNNNAFTISPLGVEMIKIPSGHLIMRTEKDRNVVITNSFFISSHEITIGQYKKLPLDLTSKGNINKPNQPITNISWYDAMKFCKLLTAKEKEAGKLPEGYEYRLPTETEWEYAAGAGSKELYYYGSMPERLILYAVYNSKQLNNIKTKKPNKFGLYDTLGNAWEWCYDAEEHKSILARINPVSIGNEYSNRAIRGGSASTDEKNTTLATQRYVSPHTKNSQIGFRIVLGKTIK